MKSSRVKQVLTAAAALPPAKGRALIAALALAAKEPVEAEPDAAALLAALREDLKPLGDALAGALATGDLPAMQAALRRISRDMPELAGDAATLTATLTATYAEAWLDNPSPTVQP